MNKETLRKRAGLLPKGQANLGQKEGLSTPTVLHHFLKKERAGKRDGLLPKGQKNIGEKKPVASKATGSRELRVNGRIEAGQVDLRDEKGKRWGIVPLKEALTIARAA